MKRLLWMICLVPLGMGCSREGSTERGSEEAPISGLGRFMYSGIRSTVGPADGPATLLILSESPITEKSTEPQVHIGLHGFPNQWSEKTTQFQGGSLKDGWGTIRSSNDSKNLSRVKVRFGTIKIDEPVEGEYDITLPDGTRSGGLFRVTWIAKKIHE